MCLLSLCLSVYDVCVNTSQESVISIYFALEEGHLWTPVSQVCCPARASQPFFYLCLSSQNPPANSMWLGASGLQLWGVLWIERATRERWKHRKQQLLCNLAESQPCMFITGFLTDGTLFFLTGLTTWSVGSYLKLAQTTYLLFVIVCIPVTASFPAEMFNASVWLSTK